MFFLLEYIIVSQSLPTYPWDITTYFFLFVMTYKQIVFYVFNPALVSSNLAKTITFSSLVTM